jgi:hypothetical protein
MKEFLFYEKKKQAFRCMSQGGFWGAYTRLPKETRLRLGVAGILFSVLGIVATPGAVDAWAGLAAVPGVCGGLGRTQTDVCESLRDPCASVSSRTRVRACPPFSQRISLPRMHAPCILMRGTYACGRTHAFRSTLLT